jgi:hypothetical protein
VAELKDFDASFDRCFGMVAFQLNRYLIDHTLRVGRQLTGDDYEAMLIWGVLAHQNVAHLLPPGSHPCSVLNERGRVDLGRARNPLRLRDVAQITRLPRETVRRKLEKLAAAGRVERVAEGWLITQHEIDDALREFSRDNVRRFLATADEVMRCLRAADAEVAASRPAEVTLRDAAARPAEIGPSAP